MKDLLKELEESDLSPLSKEIVKDLISEGTEERQRQRALTYGSEISRWVEELQKKGIIDEQD